MASQKISQFNVSTSLTDNDLFTFVVNSTNKTISYSDFKLSLGVTGVLNQAGNALAAPVLDKVGTDYNIRNIESGPGIKASVSAEDGINLSINLEQDNSGAQIISNKTALTTKYRSIIGGSGVNVSEDGERIQISSSQIALSTKTVLISQESDFPTPVGGVITLEPLTKYQLVNDITTANRFVLQDRTVISGDSGALSVFHYTGSDTMFSWVNAVVVFDNLRVNAPAATLFEGTSPGLPLGSFIIERCSFDNCSEIGTIGDMFAIRWDNATFINVTTNGVLLTGNTSYVEMESSFINQLTGTLLDLGASTFDGFSFLNSVVITSGSATLLSGLANSGNVNTNGIATVVNNRSQGALNVINITPDDALWQFLLNDTIPDTRPDGLLSMQGNATNTAITSAGVGALAVGTWVLETLSQMSGTVAGRLTYDGGKDAKLPISASVTIEPVSGGSQDMGILIAINGTIIANSLRVSSTSSGSPVTLDAHWQENIEPTDFIEVFVTNESGTTDVLVSSAILRVN